MKGENEGGKGEALSFCGACDMIHPYGKCKIREKAKKMNRWRKPGLAKRQRFLKTRNEHAHLVREFRASVKNVCAVPGCYEHEKLVVDHIVPLQFGGTWDWGNLQLICAKHHKIKNFDEYKKSYGKADRNATAGETML